MLSNWPQFTPCSGARLKVVDNSQTTTPELVMRISVVFVAVTVMAAPALMPWGWGNNGVTIRIFTVTP